MSHFTTIKTQNQRHRRSVLGRSGNGPVPAAGDPEDHAFTPSTGNLAIYLRAARYPIASAAPLLLKEAEQKPGSVTILEAFEFLGEAAILLGELGSPARAAIPALERRLDDTNELVRLAAAQAVWRISHEAKKALPVLLAILDSEPPRPPPARGQSSSSDDYRLIRTIEAIEEMGPAAREAVPALKRVRTFSMSARRAVNAALAAIRSEPP